MSSTETTKSTHPPKKTFGKKAVSVLGVLSGSRLIGQTATNVTGIKNSYSDFLSFVFRKPASTRKPYKPATASEYRVRYANVQRTACVMIAVTAYCTFGAVIDHSHLAKLVSYSIMGGVSFSLYLGYTRMLYRVRLQYVTKQSALVTWAEYLLAVKASPLNLLPISIPKNNKNEGVAQ